MWAPILSAIRSSPVRSSILLLSGVRDGQLAALYRGATVFAYPSLYEGHGSPVAEAMSSGVPVVTSGTSALKEIGIGASELVDPLDTGAIAEAISGLLTDQRHRARLSSAGMERARAYSHAAAAEEIRRAYEVH